MAGCADAGPSVLTQWVMSGLTFGLVLIAAFLHAAWNFLLKRVNAGLELVWLFLT